MNKLAREAGFKNLQHLAHRKDGELFPSILPAQARELLQFIGTMGGTIEMLLGMVDECYIFPEKSKEIVKAESLAETARWLTKARD